MMDIQIAVFVGVVTTILITMFNILLSFWIRKEVKSQVEIAVIEVGKVQDKLGVKLDVIHELTNSTMEKTKADLEAALERIDGLKNLVKESRKAS